MKQFLFLILASVSLCFGANRFVLDAELRTTFADDGSSSQFLTGYTYDAAGNRILSRVWNGADSTVAAMSTDKFTYNGAGNVIEELLLSGSDTSTIVRYAYSGVNLIAVHTLAKNGTLRYTDSLLYDGQGRNVEEQRISSAGVKTFYHRYTLNASGKMTSDSLYELVSTLFVATQAVLFTYNQYSTVATETQWRQTSGSWYCVSTLFMSYAAGSLISVATHERDGVGTAMTDSLAYAYDGFGNRTREEDYDGSKVLLHRIVYTWRDTQPTIALMSGKSHTDQRFALNAGQRRLTADLFCQDRGVITIFDMTGKLMCRIAVDHSGIVPLQGRIGNGSFIAVYSTGSLPKQVVTFTQYN